MPSATGGRSGSVPAVIVPPETVSVRSGQTIRKRSSLRPHQPIWIPGGGSVETWQWCAQMDYVYACLSYFGFKDGRATMHGFWEEMARLGKEPNPYRAGFLQSVGVA